MTATREANIKATLVSILGIGGNQVVCDYGILVLYIERGRLIAMLDGVEYEVRIHVRRRAA